eukprot:Skav233530  [mRNA]  locus=scaffold4243:35503:41786:+ [translate_table: standard]
MGGTCVRSNSISPPSLGGMGCEDSPTQMTFFIEDADRMHGDGRVAIPAPALVSNYEANLAFDGDSGTCWWSSSNDPGSWIGLHVKTPLYARRWAATADLVNQQGTGRCSWWAAGSRRTLQPGCSHDQINVQFYVDGLWYTLQWLGPQWIAVGPGSGAGHEFEKLFATGDRSFAYTESCVTLTSDFSTIFGNEYDTIAPEMISSIPDAAATLVVSGTQRIALYFSELVVVTSGSEMSLLDAGDDDLCGTADDGTVTTIPADLPSQYVRNGTEPRRVRRWAAAVGPW